MVVVVGGGVIGLTTAVSLAEAGFDVRVWSADPPNATTSRLAGAMWGSAFAGPSDLMRRWAVAGLEELSAIAREPGSGVRIARGVLASSSEDGPPPSDLFPGVEIRPGVEPPPGFAAAFEVHVPLATMPLYLAYLEARLARAGVEIEHHAVDSLADAAEVAPAVVNCTGLAARDLVPDPDVRPLRGDRVVLENPGLDDFFISEPFGPEWISIFPHADHILLGGTLDDGNWDTTPDSTAAERMVERCSAVEPRLRGARVLRHEVGLRPGRSEIRVEEEPLNGARLIHNYGHGGVGVSMSWGCAHDVRDLLSRRRPHRPAAARASGPPAP
jgi:D-amino-acid oxidase